MGTLVRQVRNEVKPQGGQYLRNEPTFVSRVIAKRRLFLFLFYFHNIIYVCVCVISISLTVHIRNMYIYIYVISISLTGKITCTH